MSANYQLGDIDAHEALIQAQAAALEAEHREFERDLVALLGSFRVVRGRLPGGNSGIHHPASPHLPVITNSQRPR
jgi:hypothetical protein